MTLLTVPHCSVTNAVSPDGATSPDVAPLDPSIYRDMRWCIRCGGQENIAKNHDALADHMNSDNRT
jgi:hypothetical protein